MRALIGFCLLVLPLVSSAQTYTPVQLKASLARQANVSEVKLLETREMSEVDKYGNHENRTLVLTFGLQAVASLCETFSDVQIVNAQSSIESELNPSDIYYSIPTEWKKGCATGSFGNPRYLKFDVVQFIDQRKASEVGKPWPAPKWMIDGEAIKYFSFYREMLGGYHVMSLYRLDFTDPTKVKFDFKKDYTYVQGEVQ